jgi:lipoyl(octanoyl) transferase
MYQDEFYIFKGISPNSQPMPLHKFIFRDLGLIDYKKAWDMQERLFREIVSKKERRLNHQPSLQEETHDYLLFCEHPHVFTVGKNGSESNLLVNQAFLREIHASFYKINRGGDITYHGPGQIVGYPILDLENLGLSIKRYIHLLEESVILTLKTFGLTAGRLSGATGVWLDPADNTRTRKICAIGVRTSRWVTMHGFAFNVNTDLHYFNYINPCGFTDKAVTSLEKETGIRQDVEKVKAILLDNLIRVFNIGMINEAGDRYHH